MQTAFPDATEEELDAADRICIICREPMTSAKKLRCGHMFHFHCLRSWLERQQTCPYISPVSPMYLTSSGSRRAPPAAPRSSPISPLHLPISAPICPYLPRCPTCRAEILPADAAPAAAAEPTPEVRARARARARVG